VPPYKGPGVDTFIKEFGRHDLLDYSTLFSKFPFGKPYETDFVSVNMFWINQGAPNEEFWAHEFSKHATCTSTFDVACYGPDYKEHMDVVNFYETVVRVFQQYPTYSMLQSCGTLDVLVLS
jgi:ribonuclease T2